MQLLVSLGKDGVVEISCPGCASLLGTIREQDWRVHIMLHPAAKCRWSKQTLRVDRLSGYAEPWPEVKEESSCESSTEDETRISTITNGRSLPTGTIRPTRPTRLGTRAGAPGRTRLYRGQG